LFDHRLGRKESKQLGRCFEADRRDPSTLIQLFAACGHFLIIGACAAGFLRLGPTGRRWGEFVVGGVLAVGFLLVMAFTVGPPEAAVHIKGAIGL